jgi:hypothetical protein
VVILGRENRAHAEHEHCDRMLTHGKTIIGLIGHHYRKNRVKQDTAEQREFKAVGKQTSSPLRWYGFRANPLLFGMLNVEESSLE